MHVFDDFHKLSVHFSHNAQCFPVFCRTFAPVKQNKQKKSLTNKKQIKTL